ncbi:MAG: four helix bundle protein [Armatimonadota bacterium]
MSIDSQQLSERMMDCAVDIINLVDALPSKLTGRHIAGQLLRSGTSVAANYEEACAAESRADFIHKLQIVLKELRESRFWLRLIVRSKVYNGTESNQILKMSKSDAISSRNRS